jgi:hypothetical protein
MLWGLRVAPDRPDAEVGELEAGTWRRSFGELVSASF